MSINIACLAFSLFLMSIKIAQDVLTSLAYRSCGMKLFAGRGESGFGPSFFIFQLALLSVCVSVTHIFSYCVMALTSNRQKLWQVQLKITRGRFQDRAVKPAVLGWRNAPVTGPIRVPLAFRVATAVIFLRIRMVEYFLVLTNVAMLDVRLNV